MKNKVYEFKVEGSGYFPVDMLRYDCAWPACQDDCPSVTAQPRDLAESFMQPRQVLLHGIKEPTIDRWRSFGWVVLKTVVWKRGKMAEAYSKQIL